MECLAKVKGVLFSQRENTIPVDKDTGAEDV